MSIIYNLRDILNSLIESVENKERFTKQEILFEEIFLKHHDVYYCFGNTQILLRRIDMLTYSHTKGYRVIIGMRCDELRKEAMDKLKNIKKLMDEVISELEDDEVDDEIVIKEEQI